MISREQSYQGDRAFVQFNSGRWRLSEDDAESRGY